MKSKSRGALQPLPAPVNRAIVFICQKCGKRAGGSEKHASSELASKIKRATKREFGKGEVRVVLTTCMDACPEEGISVALQPVKSGSASMLLQADVHDVDGGSEALLQLVRQMTDE